MAAFLQEMFLRVGGAFVSRREEEHPQEACSGAPSQAVEHVVDETYSRLRAIPDYSRRLMGPVETTFRYIDGLVEEVPGAILCNRAAFTNDPRVSAFFVSPRHLQEVFSQNAEVRGLLDRNPEAEECWALLCMRKEERRQLGMSLVGDAVQREVMQTVVSFTDHQVLSPGSSEAQARRALKCCIFNALLGYIRSKASAAKTNSIELTTRLKSLRGRLKGADTRADAEQSRGTLQTQIDELEHRLGDQDVRLGSLEDHLQFVVDVLANPTQFLSGSSCSLQLNRMGIKQEKDVINPDYEVSLSEIRVASQEPRVGALVRFLRAELLPRRDFVSQADIFLAI